MVSHRYGKMISIKLTFILLLVEHSREIISYIVGTDITSRLIAPSVLVATAALILQYISHRSSVLDTQFERQNKIHQFTGEQPVNVPKFTKHDYMITVELTKTVVKEKDGKLYKIWKYLNPLKDIDGTTIMTFFISNTGNIDTGLYAIEGWSSGSLINRGMIMHHPYQKSMLFVEIDSVEVREVTPTLADIAYSDSLELTEDDEVLKENLNVFL